MFKFELALVEAAIDNTTVRATFTKDIDTMISDLAAGVLPGPSSDRNPTVLEIGVDPASFIRVCTDPDASQPSVSEAVFR